jgi:hypothetical protein
MKRMVSTLGMGKVETRGYWQQRGLDPAENPGISHLAIKCKDILWSISTDYTKGNHGLRDRETHLWQGFMEWISYEKLSVGTAAGLDILLQDDRQSEFYIMTVQELRLMLSQLTSFQEKTEQRATNKTNRRKRRRDDIENSSAAKHRQPFRSGSRAKKLSPEPLVDARSLSSGCVSTSSTKSTKSAAELKNECSKIDRTLERLKQISSLCRQVAVESRFPELDELLDGEDNNFVRYIYPKSRSFVLEKFPRAREELQIRVSASMGTMVRRLVKAKQDSKDDCFSEPFEPSLNYGRAPKRRSHTIEVESSKWKALPVRTARRAATAGPRPGLYPTLISDQDFQEEPSQYQTSRSSPDISLEPTLSPNPTAPNRVDCKFYVCTVPDCKNHILFEDRQTWEDHLRTHPQLPTWTCTAIRHGMDLPEFPSVSGFEDHMWSEHSGSFDKSDLPELADACKKPHSCSLCLNPILDDPSKEDWSKSILDHMNEHFVELESICLQWVPEYETMDTEPPFDQWKGNDSTTHSVRWAVGNAWVEGHCSGGSN